MGPSEALHPHWQNLSLREQAPSHKVRGKRSSPLRLTQVIQQLMGRITICRPAKGLLCAADRLARIGADDAVWRTCVVLSGREQRLQFNTL